MARTFRRHTRPLPPELRRKCCHWFGGVGMGLGFAGWGLILLSRVPMSPANLRASEFPYRAEAKLSNELITAGIIVLCAAVLASIVGTIQRSWTGWVGLLVSAGVALLLGALTVLLIILCMTIPHPGA
jgi:hypothetical protein